MTVEIRGQGRPPRGDGEVGRERLLDRTRDALKVKPRVDLQRREIAISAGVTPALVSYYYRDKWDLFAAAAKPVIENFVANVRAVIQREMSSRQKMALLVHLYIEFNFHNGYLLDFCNENKHRMNIDDQLSIVDDLNLEVAVICQELLKEGVVKSESPTFIQTSIWGLCKHLAQKSLMLSNSPELDDLSMFSKLAADVCALIFNREAPSEIDEGLKV